MATAAGLAKKYKTLLEKHRINTPLRLAHFFAQLDHESNLEPKRESLYYTSADRAKNIFKSPFKNKDTKFISQYLKNTPKMANYVYANRMGNGDEASGDGYKFRGGGFMQHTGANEYKILQARTGIAFYDKPELIEDEVNALIAAIDYWNRLGLSNLADKDDIDGISDLINIGRQTEAYGDSNDFKDRLKKLQTYKQTFK